MLIAVMSPLSEIRTLRSRAALFNLFFKELLGNEPRDN